MSFERFENIKELLLRKLSCDGNSGYSWLKATFVCVAMVVLFGGLEALLILTLRVS